jgi:hypothetical protein
MRRPTIIAYFPRLGVTVLGSTLLLSAGYSADAHAAPKAPKSAGGAAAPDPTGTGDAAAGPDAKTKKAAREEYSAGEKAYKAGDYSGAYDHFKKAAELIPNIHAKYWMAMAQSYGADKAAAYDGLIAIFEAPDKSKLGDDKLDAANGRLEELKKTPASLNITSTPAGATVSVDGAAKPGETPATVSITAGAHHITVMKPGYELYETDVTAKPGQKMDQAVELKAKSADSMLGAAGAGGAATTAAPPPKETTPPPAPPPKEERSKLPAYITLGVGVVGAGVGTVFGIMALGAKSDFDQNPTSDNADKAERNALIADMSFGVALTLGITGIVLLTAGGDEPSEVSAKRTLHHAPRAKLDVAPILTHTTQGAAARFVF